ncbi:MAG: flagellar FlbD family protein [Caldilineaceae bacterium]|nr:flagellar FlbD family protein [Caldilineaceae bacterium]
MISVTRLDGREFTLNADLIESIESNPDTFIRLVNSNSYVVRESRQEVVERIVNFRRRVFQCGMRPSVEAPSHAASSAGK